MQYSFKSFFQYVCYFYFYSTTIVLHLHIFIDYVIYAEIIHGYYLVYTPYFLIEKKRGNTYNAL